MVPKILIIPPMRPWYMEAHAEYIIRYLSDEFFIEVADVPYPPYEHFLDRYPETNPLQRSPDDYDLIWPMLSTHWVVTDRNKYAHKTVIVMYEPGEGRYQDVAAVGCATPEVEEQCKVPFTSVRFGIDTHLFQPRYMKRTDDLLHVGIVGTHINPRRQIMEGIIPLIDNIPGVRFMFFPSTWVNNGGDLNKVGGDKFLKNVVSGDKYWPGLPNIYNQLDVLVRIDNSYGYSFPVLEAAACGVPVIATYQGIDHFITGPGGGIMLWPNPPHSGRWPFNEEEQLVEKLRGAITSMRDNPGERINMGIKAREEIMKSWTWDHCISGWRELFRKGLDHVRSLN